MNKTESRLSVTDSMV